MTAIVFFTFVTTLMVILVAYRYATRKEQVVSERMSQYVQPMAHKQWEAAQTANWREVVRKLGRYASAAPKVHDFDEKMLQAGISLKGSEFIVLSVGFAVIIGLVCIVLTQGGVIAATVSGLVAYLLALMYIKIKIARRLADFNNQLGDALGLMANALRSGFSFFQAVEMVAKEMTPPLSSEFARLLKEMSLGVTTENALLNLTRRIKSSDLELVVTAVLIQRQIGGNLAQILDNIASTIRERIMMKREIRTLTAQGRLSGWIVGLLPVVLTFIISMINPGYIGMLFTEQLGRVLIAGAVVSQLLGVIVIRKIVNIDL